MKNSRCPIVIDLPENIDSAQILLASDMHNGSACFDGRAWNEFEKLIQQENNYVIFCGDQMEYATRSSKSDVYESTRPAEQKRWWIERMRNYTDKILCIIDGNHEYNRASKDADDFPLYDIALTLGIEDRYRSEAAFVDIGIGAKTGHRHGNQIRYVGRIQHKAQNLCNFSTADAFDGIDFFVSGHTHKPMDKPLKKLIYNPHNHCVIERNVENIVCSSFMSYGGYGERAGMRPTSDKKHSLIIDGTRKNIETRGFYV